MEKASLEMILTELIRMNAKMDAGFNELRGEMRAEFRRVDAEFKKIHIDAANTRKELKIIRDQTALNSEEITSLRLDFQASGKTPSA